MGTAHATRYLACMVLGIACAVAAVHPTVVQRVGALATHVGRVAPLHAWRPPARVATHCKYA